MCGNWLVACSCAAFPLALPNNKMAARFQRLDRGWAAARVSRWRGALPSYYLLTFASKVYPVLTYFTYLPPPAAETRRGASII